MPDDSTTSQTVPDRLPARSGAAAAWFFLAVLAAALAWAYWPTILDLLHTWETSPDYSHGYLVVPLALYFLWSRRDAFPGFRQATSRMALLSVAFGLLLILLSITVRWQGARYRFGAVDAWSMLLWMAGVAWIFGGWPLFRWAWPSIVFLFFMIPLPYRLDRMLTVPLQRVATEISTWTLQSLGQPAFAMGNVITLGEHELEVADACSGLRILVGVFAIAFAYCVLIRRSWWKRVAVVIAAIPVALVANATRIVATGLLYQLVSAEAGQKFSHDVAGWMMIPLAAALFALVVWYVDKLFPEVEVVEMRDLYARHDRNPAPSRAPKSPASVPASRPGQE